jgi:hypothetical protein
MRKYYPIWSKLKQSKDGTASIVAHPLLHARIIKAVTKEKWMDTSFKLQVLPYYFAMTYEVKGNMITFKLTKFLSSQAIGAADV